ncbi:MAG: tetratricopeptide repeat protein [Bryobacteraceae bacterium]
MKLLDFGLARRAVLGESETTLALEGEIVGTPAYMSPEQAEGKPLDARSDVFSFGAVLYEMLTGRKAFLGETAASVLGAVLREDPRPLGNNISHSIEKVVIGCLQKDPARRFQIMDDVHAALQHAVTANSRLPRWSASLGALGIVILLSALVAANIGKWRGRVLGRASPSPIQSLAVLPVRNYSGDAGQEFLADGMTDALISDLAQIRALRVISLTSAMHYKATHETVPQIAGELGVTAIVEASVVRSGSRMRISARLIDARHEWDLWTNTYEREGEDILALQADVARAIADEVRAQITPAERERLRTIRRVDSAAYEDVLRARSILQNGSREHEFRKASELFQKAVDRDPTYATAWAGLAVALWSLAETGFEYVAPEEVRDRAISAANRALELDPNLAEAHKACAVVASDAEWDFARAQLHFDRAVELRPGDADAHNGYGQLLIGLQRFDEARRHLDRARELDPISPWYDESMVGWWLFQGRPERALQLSEQIRDRNPKLWIIPWQVGFAELLLGQPGNATRNFEAALELLKPDRPSDALTPLGLAYGLAGRRADALRVLAEMEQTSHQRYISPHSLAVVYSGLGRMDEAFRFLDRALDERTPSLSLCTRYDPISVALRRDPRWKSFIDRLRQLIRLPPGNPDPYS